jgi:hypothetical protein
MENKILIALLDESKIHWQNSKYALKIENYLSKLKDNNPTDLVQLQVGGGECEEEGIWAPYRGGDVRTEDAKPFKEGEAVPDDDAIWIRIG